MDVVTELTIFVLAAFVGFAVISKVPTTLHTPLMSQTNAIHGIVMLGGLIVTVPTALTGFADWLVIRRGTALWRTATLHLSAMLTATVVFGITARAGHADYVDRAVSGGALVLTLIGYGVMGASMLLFVLAGLWG